MESSENAAAPAETQGAQEAPATEAVDTGQVNQGNSPQPSQDESLDFLDQDEKTPDENDPNPEETPENPDETPEESEETEVAELSDDDVLDIDGAEVKLSTLKSLYKQSESLGKRSRMVAEKDKAMQEREAYHGRVAETVQYYENALVSLVKDVMTASPKMTAAQAAELGYSMEDAMSHNEKVDQLQNGMHNYLAQVSKEVQEKLGEEPQGYEFDIQNADDLFLYVQQLAWNEPELADLAEKSNMVATFNSINELLVEQGFTKAEAAGILTSKHDATIKVLLETHRLRQEVKELRETQPKKVRKTVLGKKTSNQSNAQVGQMTFKERRAHATSLNMSDSDRAAFVNRGDYTVLKNY